MAHYVHTHKGILLLPLNNGRMLVGIRILSLKRPLVLPSDLLLLFRCKVVLYVEVCSDLLRRLALDDVSNSLAAKCPAAATLLNDCFKLYGKCKGQGCTYSRSLMFR